MLKPPELAQLEYFVGTWKSAGEIKASLTSAGGQLIMTEQYEWMEGGFFLVIRSGFSSPMGSGSGMAFMGYDTARQIYTYDEFNSTGEAQHSTGTLDGDTWTWSGEQHLGGMITKTRFMMKMVSATVYSFRFETSPDGIRWSPVMEGSAARQ